MRTIAILPVKRFTSAKQRLSRDVDPQLRAALAEAMLEDVLEGLSASERLTAIVVVTADRRAGALAARYGARVLEDLQTGHNQAAAIGIGAAAKAGAQRVLLMPGDCPALDPAEIDELLERPIQPPSALIVPDRHGTGTNALLLTPPGALAPSFGPDSCARHCAHARAARVHHEVLTVRSLAIDIDTTQDLDELTGNGRAPRTLALLARC